jgi:hypothetical protein
VVVANTSGNDSLREVSTVTGKLIDISQQKE